MTARKALFAVTVLAAALAGCGTFSVPGTPETATSLNGFLTRRGPPGARAENVAYGCKHSPCVIQQWVNSSGHRKNMLIPSLTRYGLASATSVSGKKYRALLVGE